MNKRIKIYDLHDPQQYEDEREYWRKKTPEEKLEVLEAIRSTWNKLDQNQHENPPGFQRVFRIIDPDFVTFPIMKAVGKKICDYAAADANIAVAYLFGSEATGLTHRESDVDVALLYNTEHVPSADLLLQIQDDLTSLLKREVDVVILNHASPIIRMQVLRKGKKIFERNRRAYLDFFVRTINEYDDLKKVRSVIERNIISGSIYG